MKKNGFDTKNWNNFEVEENFEFQELEIVYFYSKIKWCRLLFRIVKHKHKITTATTHCFILLNEVYSCTHIYIYHRHTLRI